MELTPLLGDLGTWLVYLGLGFGFGFILESSGFGDARKLAGQFYFRDFAVLKVMFTAIVVCMILIFWGTALGWLDYDRLWVNPTYWWPHIVGGLIMGAGFILGGYCPGTSLVSLATLKLDGLMFVAGVALGVFSFGETEALFNEFWHSGNAGRLTLAEWLDLPVGLVVFGLTCIAVVLFWAADWWQRRRQGRPS
jgi:hypothetical protein